MSFLPIVVTHWTVLDVHRNANFDVTYGRCLFNVIDCKSGTNEHLILPFDNGINLSDLSSKQIFDTLGEPWNISAANCGKARRLDREVYPMIVSRLASNSGQAIEQSFPPLYKKGITACIISGCLISHFCFDVRDLDEVLPRPLTIDDLYISLNPMPTTWDILQHCLSLKQSTYQGIISLFLKRGIQADVTYLKTDAFSVYKNSYEPEVGKHYNLDGTVAVDCVYKAMVKFGRLKETNLKAVEFDCYKNFLRLLEKKTRYFDACSTVMDSVKKLPRYNLGNDYDCMKLPHAIDYLKTGLLASYIFMSKIYKTPVQVTIDIENVHIIHPPWQCYSHNIIPYISDAYGSFPVYNGNVNDYLKATEHLLQRKSINYFTQQAYNNVPSPTVDCILSKEDKSTCNGVMYLKSPGHYTGRIRKLDFSNFMGTILNNLDTEDVFLARLINTRNQCHDQNQKKVLKQGIVHKYGLTAHMAPAKFKAVNTKARQIMLQMVAFLENECNAQCIHIMVDGIIFLDPESVNVCDILNRIQENNLHLKDEGTFNHAIMLSLNSYALVTMDGKVETTGMNFRKDAPIVTNCLDIGMSSIIHNFLKTSTLSECLDSLTQKIYRTVEAAKTPEDYKITGPPKYSYLSSCRDFTGTEFLQLQLDDSSYVKVKTYCQRDKNDINTWCYNPVKMGCFAKYINLHITENIEKSLESDMKTNFVSTRSLLHPVIIDYTFYLERSVKLLFKIVSTLWKCEKEVDVAMQVLLSSLEQSSDEKILKLHGEGGITLQKPGTISEALKLLKDRFHAA